MTRRTTTLLILFVLIITAVSLNGLVSPPPALAQNCPDNNPSLPEICRVRPNEVYNDVASTLTVIGNDFVDAVVILEGYSTLQTTAVGTDNDVLTAVIPPGVPAGTYNVRVVNATGHTTVRNNAVTVLDALDITPEATNTPAPTSTPLPTDFIRPIVTILSYGASSPILYPGQEIDTEMTLQNNGAIDARNVRVNWVEGGNLIPRDTGGVRALGDMTPGATIRFFQPFRVDSNLIGYEVVETVQITYTDQYGNEYSETSEISFDARQPVDTPTPTPTLTPTATLSVRPQLIVEGYTTTVDPLVPGAIFNLDAMLVNVSGEVARQAVVTLNVPDTSLNALAPLSSSNVRYIEEMAPGERVALSYNMAVSGTAEGGLIPVQFNLSYIDNFNVQHDETETISLVINAQPLVQIGFFDQLPDLILVGDFFDLPVEVINIGTQQINISTISITSDRLDLTDASLYVGPLDGGTSASLVPTAEALQAGTVEITVTINYLDSFQQPQVVTEVLTVEVEAIPLDALPDEGDESEPERGGLFGRPRANNGTDAAEEDLSLGQRIWRGFLGFLGLGTRG